MGKFWFAFAVILLPLLIFGCAEEKGRSGVLEPSEDDPIILESVVCLDIEDDRPVGIADTFLASDERICLWIYWINIEGRNTVEVAWFEPDEDLPSLEESEIIDSSSGLSITWFSIEKPLSGFARGEWSVDVYLNDQFERSHLFMVE